MTAIKFGKTNDVPSMTITASRAVTTATDLDWLKNEYRSRPAQWDTPNTDVTVTGTLATASDADYFSIPGSDLLGGVTVQVKVFETDVSTTDLLAMTPVVIPDEEWNDDNESQPGSLTFWFGSTIEYRRFELVITTPANYDLETDYITLRTLHMGEALEMSKTFSFGSTFSYLTEPEYRQTESGSVLPSRTQRNSRELSISLDHATDTDRLELSKFERNNRARPFIVSSFPDSSEALYTNYTFMARFGTRLKYVHRGEGRHSAGLVLVEV